LLLRNYRRFSGGHLTAWYYFNHILSSPHFTAEAWFSKKSTFDYGNPWRDASDYISDRANPARPDVVLVGGRNWKMWDEHPHFDPDTPVINLVQNVRHGDAANKRFQFLQRKAVRICVSEEVARAILATGLTSGPVLVIPLGLDLENLPSESDEGRDIDILIAGLKQPEIGAQLQERLRKPGRRVELLTTQLPRSDFLERIRLARVTVFLPNFSEGCFMPSLEGMALGTTVVCPDVHGVAYCIDGYNAFRPNYSIDELIEAAESALALSPERERRLRANARQTAETNTLQRERQSFLGVLHRVDEFWTSSDAVVGSFGDIAL
jgi:glycosyltransferase involved in cell wall biosynthesis